MDLQTLQSTMAGIDIPAYFTESRADLAWSINQLDDLPETVWPPIYKQYLSRRKKCQAHNARQANIWLRERTTWFRRILAGIPVRLQTINTDDRRAAVAADWANQTAQLLHHATDGHTKQVDPLELFGLVSGPAGQWGFVPRMPEFQSAERRHVWVAAQLVRYLDAKWWTRKISRTYDRYTEHAAILSGRVRRGVSPYLSNANLQIYRQRKAAAALWAKDQLVVNEEHGLELSLEVAIASSVANPENRRHELMARMRGFEDTAAELGHAGVFITWTAPSKFHPWKTSRGTTIVENKRYESASPRETQQYLSSLWVKTRAEFKRQGIAPYGFRVVEPHHDGTPHWHMMLFVPVEQVHLMIGIMQHYAILHDRDELVRTRDKWGRYCPARTDITPRFDWQIMNPAEGGATGYMAKYIAKNVDGHRVGEDFEAEQMSDKAAIAACGWASWHGIRQFQQIGGPGVGIWRELRRLADITGPAQDPELEMCRRMASAGDWYGYVRAMGGPIMPRAERPVSLLKEVEEEASRYGEDVTRLLGVMGVRVELETRLQGWVITRHGLADRQAVAARKGGALDLRGREAAPWSSDNNCTEGSENPEKGSLRRELSDHARHLGLSDEGLGQVLAGRIVKIDGRFVRYRDGKLIVSQHHMTYQRANDWGEVDMNDEPEIMIALKKDKDERIRPMFTETAAAVVAMRKEIWSLVDTRGDVSAWLASKPESMQDMAMSQLEDIVSQLEQERYIEKMVEQRGSRYAL